MPVVRIDLESRFAGWQVMAIMHWPNDQLARNNFLVTVAAEAMQHVQDELPRRVDRMLPDIAARVAATSGFPIEIARVLVAAQASPALVEAAVSTITVEIDSGLFRPSGGYGRVAAADGREAIEKAAEGQRAFGGACGILLTYIVRLVEHHPDIPASLNRAIHIWVNRAKKEGRTIPAERSRKTMWTRWGGVSPLWAAGAFCYAAATARGAPHLTYHDPDFRREMISVSLWLADFAVRFKAAGARTPLLSENKVVRVDCKLDVLRPEIPPLTDEELTWARGYRAPIPPP